MSFVNPQYIATFQEWSDYMYPTLQEYGVVAQFMPGEDWKNWAAGLLSINGIAQRGVPVPYQFSDWKDWAVRLNDALNQGS